MSAYDAGRFATIQQALIKKLGIQLPPIPETKEGLFWLKPDGQGSTNPGDVLTATDPPFLRQNRHKLSKASIRKRENKDVYIFLKHRFRN